MRFEVIMKADDCFKIFDNDTQKWCSFQNVENSQPSEIFASLSDAMDALKSISKISIDEEVL